MTDKRKYSLHHLVYCRDTAYPKPGVMEVKEFDRDELKGFVLNSKARVNLKLEQVYDLKGRLSQSISLSLSCSLFCLPSLTFSLPYAFSLVAEVEFIVALS